MRTMFTEKTGPYDQGPISHEGGKMISPLLTAPEGTLKKIPQKATSDTNVSKSLHSLPDANEDGSFANLVRAWRLKHKLKKTEASRVLKIPYRTFQNWELGTHEPRGLGRRLIIEKLSR
jgi:DNA-binding transcriptional regulator YiaG